LPGGFSIQNAEGSQTLDLLCETPTADTGQCAIPVRVISQLGAGTGGGATGGLTDAQLRAAPVDVAIVSGAAGGSGGGLTDVELRAAPVPVSGTVAVSNLPATQPVSGSVSVSNLPATQPISGSVAVSNFPATQPVSGSVGVNNWPANQPVTGTFWPATQPVSGTVAVSNFPATQPVSGAVSVSNFPAAQPVTGTFWPAVQPVSLQAADKAVSVTGAAAAQVIATLPAPGAGLFHYITRINIIAYASAARTGAATPVVVTSTNLPGGLSWTTPTAMAIGTQYETDIQLSGPLKSSAANVATTIVAPATSSVIWRINVVYYTGP
jgi:hypothetical protein